MKAKEAQLLKFLKESQQFEVPIYQRRYSWEEKQCRQLLDDILRCGEDDSVIMHFIGSVVCIESDLFQVTNNPPLLIIDGQQRVTTIMLLLHVLAEKLEQRIGKKNDLVNGFSAQEIQKTYLLNLEETDDRYFKLLLSQTDKETFKSIISERELPSKESTRITANYKLFQRWISTSQDELVALCKGIEKLYIASISLDRKTDNPHVIFESMNAKIKPLNQADLIRNFVLMGLDTEAQKNLYNEFWRPMEEIFGDYYDKIFDEFMRHYLTLKTGTIPNIKDVYEKFKDYRVQNKNIKIKDLVKEIKKFAQYYCNMVLGQEESQDLELAFNNLLELKVGVAYPLLLGLYSCYDRQHLNKDEFLEALNLIESYVFRRSVCWIPTNTLNTTFAGFTKELDEEECLKSIHKHFLSLRSYQEFPSDEEFKNTFKSRDLYRFTNNRYWLRKLENHNRKEFVRIDRFTIEHIMPQNEELSDTWIEELGANWKEIHEKYLHTLGNLTLTAYNSEYSDKPFYEKCTMENGFDFSPLKLNDGLGTIKKWDENAIKNRADKWGKIALAVWQCPKSFNN